MACEAQRFLLGRRASHHPPPDAHSYSHTYDHADSDIWQGFPASGLEELRHTHSNRDSNSYQHAYTDANLHPHQHPDAIANSHSDVYPNNHNYAYSDAHGHTDTHPYARRLKVMLEVVHLFQLRRLLMNLAQVEAKWIKGMVKRPTICPWARLRRNSSLSLSLKAGIST